MRFHVLGVPHTITSPDFPACRYTEKVLKFCKIMTERGHTVFHYGHEEAEVLCTEHVQVVSSQAWRECYGDTDWRYHAFNYSTDDKVHQIFIDWAKYEVGRRKRDKDFLVMFTNISMKPICEAHQDLISVQLSLSDTGEAWATHKSYESYSMHQAYVGTNSVSRCYPKPYDVVTPECFDADEFTFQEIKSDYFLCFGASTGRKGLFYAADISQATGIKMLVYGKGAASAKNLINPDKIENIEFGHSVDRQKRRELLAGAKATFIFSQYLDPFSSVLIESLLSGTPVITTDWGSFGENNLHGYTGYRCHTMDHIVWAVNNIDKIKPKDCRDWAMRNYSLHRIGLYYDEFFQILSDLHKPNGGFYSLNEQRESMSWLEKPIPGQSLLVNYPQIASDNQKFAVELGYWLKTKFRPQQVIDFGCALGEYTHALESLDVKSIAIDYRQNHIVDITHLEHANEDAPLFREPLPIKKAVLRINKFIALEDLINEDKSQIKADLVISMDFAARVDTYLENEIISQLIRCINQDGYLIWATATPGIHNSWKNHNFTAYINWRPREYWLNKLEKAGLHHDSTLEKIMHRALDENAPDWFKRGLIVMRLPSKPFRA